MWLSRPKAEGMSLTGSQIALGAAFLVMGVLHFAVPKPFIAIMPRFIPRQHHRMLVYLSGVAELAGGAGVFPSQTRPWAGVGLLLLLIAVFPANVQMLLNAQKARAPISQQIALWVRLPLQFVLAWWVWSAAQVGSLLA